MRSWRGVSKTHRPTEKLQRTLLAARFETHEPELDDVRDAAALRDVRLAYLARAEAERQLADAVAAARAQGHSWVSIGAMVGTSGEAAHQMHGQTVPKH